AMVGATIVVVALVVGLGLLGHAFSGPSNPTPAVAYRQEAHYAATHADFTVLAPASLPHGWRATTVRYVPGTHSRWHLGVLTDQNRYVGLEEAHQGIAPMVHQYVSPHARRGPDARLHGADWRTYTDDGGDRAFVRRDGTVTVLVVGHQVPRPVLESYIGRLR
ncbi:MAG: DUF4245 family protein, partial [Nocardioidaceae bacterium]